MTFKKVLFLTRYPRMGASSRLRTYQYVPFLNALGWDATVSPLFNEKHLDQLYQGKGTSYINVFACYIRRFFVLFTLSRYTRIVIEKELFPFLPSWAEYVLFRKGHKYIVDYDDAVFHNYDLHPSPLVRMLLKSKIENVMKYSYKVVAGNSYLAKRAKFAGAPSIILIPTVVDGNKYVSEPVNNDKSCIRIGWIGSPTTLKYLEGLLPVLERLDYRHSMELVIIGGGKSIGFKGKETLVRWSEDSEVKEIQQLDIGIMPLTDSLWDQGKCGYKLIQYMACSLPVVGSPVGVNQELIIPGKNGFLANNDLEWENHLETLILDRVLRLKMGAEGRVEVENHYTIQQILPTYLKAMNMEKISPIFK